MADQDWNGLPLMDSSAEPWEVRQPKKKKTGLVVGIVAAVVAVAAGVGAYFVFSGSKNPDKLLANAWEKTNEILEERAAGQPLGAMAAAAEQEGGTLSIEVNRLNYDGEVLLDRLGVSAVSDGKAIRADLDISAEEIQDLDLGIYLGDGRLGLASAKITGDDTFYTLDLKNPAASVRGTIFDPDTGVYPIDEDALDQLQQLGEMFDGSGAQPYDTEAMQKAFDDVKALYEEFIKSVDGEKDSGKCPGSGDKATILTYVYPSEDVIDLLEEMSNTLLDSEGFQSYFDYLSSLDASIDVADLRQTLRETFISLRRDYSGDVTVTYYIVDGEMAYLEIECDPTYQGETVEIRVDADMGLDSGVLTVDVTMAADGEEVRISLTSAQKEKGGVATDDWSLSADMMGQEAFSIRGSSEWNTSSGALESTLDLRAQGETALSLRGSGVLAADDSSFALEYDSLTLSADGESISMGLKLGYDSKASDPTPKKTRDFFSLSEEELMDILSTASTNLGYGALDDLMDLGGGDWSGSGDDWGNPSGGGWSTPADGSISAVPGFDQLGMMTLNGEAVYVPLYLESYYSDSEGVSYMSDSVSYSVYVYQDYGDTARENMEWTTDHWEDYSDTAEVSEIFASGDKAARCMREGDYVMISTIEMRGETAVYVDLAFDTGSMTADEQTLILEADWALGMPVSLSSVLY